MRWERESSARRWHLVSPGMTTLAHLQLRLHEPDLLVLLGQLVQEKAHRLHALGVPGI